MKKSKQSTFVSVFLILAYVLSACTAAPAGLNENSEGQENQAVKTSSAGDDNGNANDDNGNDANSNDANANDNTSNANDNQNSNDNANDNQNSNDNANDNSAGDAEIEVTGVVEIITTGSITVNGVTYLIADFTEFNDLIIVGDTVKIHVIVNADGTFTIREIEKTDGAGDDNSNSNSNSNTNDDNNNSNDDNSNDDNSNDNDNDNDDDNSNESNNNG